MLDLFGEKINDEKEIIHVNIYSDEIWEVENLVTGDKWIYTVAIYENTRSPILNDLINTRYLKEKEGWQKFKEQNDTNIHWAELRKDKNKKYIIERWLQFIQDDCISERKFYFSLLGINITNLNVSEFDDNQTLNSIYNRFYRSMLKSSLKKFFGKGVVVENIYHEEGSQKDHEYFNWHTILKLDEDENLNFNCREITFLPKSHKDDERSNILQLCDVLAGIYKDIHCGLKKTKNTANRIEIIDSKIIKELFIKRTIRNPKNINSSYGYANRFNISFFPKTKSNKGSIDRFGNNYYDTARIDLGIEHNHDQLKLF